jgi:hypothetical protein
MSTEKEHGFASFFLFFSFPLPKPSKKRGARFLELIACHAM